MIIHALGYHYNRFGHEPSFSLAAWFLTQKTRDYGRAANDIWVSAYFPTEGTPIPWLKSSFDEFNIVVEDLPKIRILRKKRSIEINAVTDLKVPSIDHIGHYQTTPELFQNALRELERILSHLRGKFKKSDDFDLDAFFRDVHSAVMNAPNTLAEFEQLKAAQAAHDRELEQNADPWERLGIEWTDYHRSARKILDDPFFWDCENDLAPHGNDTGADVLSSYQEWRPAHRRINPLDFLGELLVSWGVNIALAQGGDVANAKQLIEQDEFSINSYDDAMIGLVFACLKIDGKVKPEIASAALRSIARQSIASVIQCRGWRDQYERVATLERIAASLRPFAA